eukprot:TRINITY_DN16035_c0_g1_i4.p1 TRINITY_DN16035_c0_g1~~TRINITY_DN16035_c0_g1_i4.p1  ORF type:complete len:101 (+),score=23.21 TRINITY_DN16035_c0_g1_i4:113-415(+)
MLRSLVGSEMCIRDRFDAVQSQNSRGMVLKEGRGADEDELQTVWVMDSNHFGLYRAEQYHQFHSNFFGGGYPRNYTQHLRHTQMELGHIPPTGCPAGRHH